MGLIFHRLIKRDLRTIMTHYGEEVGKEVVDAAVQVHRELGPGLFETVYELVLARELERRGLAVERRD
jgi:hypothetical protein